jgi:hypothetical protein
MGQKLEGGELSKPISGSGIIIGGEKTLEELLAEEEAREMGETLVPDNLASYHKTYAKHKERRESNGPARVLTRREINAEQWEKNMENAKTIEGVIAASLLSGREVSGKELQNNCLRRINGLTKKKYSTRSTYLFHKTDFGKLIESRREARGRSYKLVSAALELKPEELLQFVYKTKARDVIVEHHKGLRPYLEEVKKEKVNPEKVEHGGVVENKPEETSARAKIQSIVPSTLGVNIFVSGKVEVIFRWDR